MSTTVVTATVCNGRVVTAEEEAGWGQWRQKVKEYTIANMNKDVEHLLQ
jgi:hypothetical protein